MIKKGRPRKYQKEIAKEMYAKNRKEKYQSMTENEKEHKRITQRKWREKNKEKLSNNRREKMKDPVYRAKKRDQRKIAKANRLKREPFAFIGEKLKYSANSRGFKAPHTNGEYKEWFYKQSGKCHYCNNDVETINKFIKKVGIDKVFRRHQIDRKDSFGDYTLDNLVLACYCCNASKSNIISHKDFLEIAEDYIKTKIESVLSD